MGMFYKMMHKRFRWKRQHSGELASIIPIVTPRKKTSRRSILTNAPDTVCIHIYQGDYRGSLELNSDEVDVLIYELSRLAKFYDESLRVKNGD